MDEEPPQRDHTGITTTFAKSLRKFWIVRARNVAKKVPRSCYECQSIEKKLAEQQMAPLTAKVTTVSITNIPHRLTGFVWPNLHLRHSEAKNRAGLVKDSDCEPVQD